MMLSSHQLIIHLLKMLARVITSVAQRFATTHAVSLLKDTREKEAYARMIEADATVEYRTYPLLPHQDPAAPEYVPSVLDEYHDKTEVAEYNRVIDEFKNKLKVQREVWAALDGLDRPYKRGVRGIDTDLDPNGVKTPNLPDLGFPRRDLLGEIEWSFQNEDRWIANTPWNQKPAFKHYQEWERERAHRPVTKDYHKAKGYKYDVPTKPEEKD